MRDLRWAILLLLGLYGCASAEELAERDDKRCVEEFGFEQRSDEYNHCREVLKEKRLQLWRSNQ